MMTTKIKKPFYYTVFSWIMTAFLLWSFGIALIISDSMKTNTVEIISTDGRWGKDTIEQIRKEAKEQEADDDFTAWTEKTGILLKNEDLGRETMVSALELDGDSGLVIPKFNQAQASGQIVREERTEIKREDTKGCLLDSNTAELLFGSQEVSGCMIKYEGRDLIVRGILKNVENLIILQKADDAIAESSLQEETLGDGGFDRITLKVSKEKEKEQEAEEFLRRHGLAGSVLHRDWMQAAGSLMSLLLPILLLGKIIKRYGKTILHYRRYPLKFLWLVLCAGIACWIFFELLDINVSLPESMIPTQWSDFAFWETWLAQKKEQSMLLTAASKSRLEVQLTHQFFGAMESGLAAAFCLPFSIVKEKEWGKAEIVLAMLLSWLIFFLLIYQYQQGGSILTEKRGIWFLLPFYMLTMSWKGYRKVIED